MGRGQCEVLILKILNPKLPSSVSLMCPFPFRSGDLPLQFYHLHITVFKGSPKYLSAKVHLQRSCEDHASMGLSHCGDCTVHNIRHEVIMLKLIGA